MKRVFILGLVSAAVVLQLSLLPALRPLGVVPNLALVVVVLIALNIATSEALIAAVVCGLILDLGGSANFGLWTGTFVLVTLAISQVDRAGIELDGLWVAGVLVGASSVVMTLAIWSALATHGGGFPLSAAWGGRLAVELVLNLVLTAMLRPLVRSVLPHRGAGLGPGE